jgi:peptidoglycan L-alanyl-D-glutamate endopeptidase CwlK
MEKIGYIQKYFGKKVYLPKEKSVYKFSKSSIAKLKTCHPLLQVIAMVAIKEIDFVVVCGTRTKEEQAKAFAGGFSKVKYPNSKHNHLPSLAMDLAPYKDGGIPWNDSKAFDALAAIIVRIAKENATPLVWGGSWKKFPDKPHFELSIK